jgi:predicted Zn finger-like uncharacterized protein
MNKLRADVTCKKCKNKFRIKLSDIGSNKRVKCPKCGTTVRFTVNDRRKAEKLFSDCERALKEMKKILEI